MNTRGVVPILRVGAGESDGSTGMCAMQVVSWENGDTTITDYPSCADRFLARVVQRVNDSICGHRDGALLCPECSLLVLDLAHRTVGTALSPEPCQVWVRIAAEEAERVLPVFEATYPGDDRPRAAVEAALRWAGDPSEVNGRAAYAASSSVTSAAAASADISGESRLAQAHRIIDRFEALTGVHAPTPDPAVVEAAVRQMQEVRA